MYADHLFSEVIAFVTNTLSLRRTCCLWQCSKDLQSHNTLWLASCCRRTLLLLCIPRLLDGQPQFQRSIWLVLRVHHYRWFNHLVRYRSDISQVLRGDESPENRQANAPVRTQSTAIRGVVVCLWDRLCPLRACLSLSGVATIATDVFLAWHSYCESLQFSAWDVFLKNNWSAITFVTSYVPVILFPILYVAAKFIMGVQTVKADDMDFDTNVAEFDAMTCVPLYCGKRHVRATKLTSRVGTMTPHRRTSWRRSGCG
jgi:hypothetical protein